MNCKSKANNEGFSLIELIVVVLILGILTVGLTPQVIKWVDNARRASDLDYMHNLESAVQYALMDAEVSSEVSSAVNALGTALVLIVNSSGTNDPVNDGEDSLLLKKTADVLGFGSDIDSFRHHKISTAGGEIRISITGGQVVGNYRVNGSEVDFSDE